MAQSGQERSTMSDALIGVAAGALAIWVLDRVDWFNFEHESPESRRRTKAVRPGGMDPAHVIANKLAESLGYDLQPKDYNKAGLAVHYSIGMLPAALYSVLRHKAPALTTGQGTLFGLGLFLVQDEGLNAVTGLSAPPAAYPWQAHARGLVAHLVYGLVLETTLSTADRLLSSKRPGEVQGPERNAFE